VFRIDGFVGLKLVRSTRRAPIVRLGRLALVSQSGDALRESRAVVCLKTSGIEIGVAPVGGDELLSSRRIGPGW